MSAFCGAWVLSGASAESAVAPAARAAMRRACGPDVGELFDGPLWLCAAAGDLARGPERLTVVSGVADADDATLAGGQLSGARASAGRGSLTLFRGAFGTERLCHAQIGGVLYFASRARPLLAGGLGGGVNTETAREAVLSGDLGILFGSASLFAGIDELRPGESLEARGGKLTRSRGPAPFPETAVRAGPETPRSFRAELLDATRRAIGHETKVSIALSGGLDSSTVAALAVDVLGADNVEAFTYEYEDSSRRPETSYAALVCRRLGIRHHVVPVSFRGCLERLPELLWRLEMPRPPASGALLPLADAVATHGLPRLLTGFGVELALGIPDRTALLAEIAQVLPSVPAPGRSLRFWRMKRFHRWPLDRAAGLLHPGLKTPPRDLYHLVLCVLRHNGVIDDVAPFYPRPLRESARAAAESARVAQALAELAALPLREQWRRLRFDSYRVHRELGGKASVMRELGASPVCPAFFLRAALARGGELDGRALHRAAMASDLPAEVLDRPKVYDQTIISRDWFRRIEVALRPLSADAARLLAQDDSAREALRLHYGSELGVLGLWLRIFDGGAPATAPTFSSLGLEGLCTPKDA